LTNPLVNFGPNQGWKSQEATPRLMGDVDGDGAADIVGFVGPRTFSALNDGAGGFAGTTGAVNNFANAQGWKTQDGQTRLLGDVDGDGDADIVGFGFRAGFVSFSNGDGTFSGFRRAVGNFANDQGWQSDNDTPRVMGDINGDGVDDIIGFGAKKTFVALGLGDGTFGSTDALTEDFSRDRGWSSFETLPRHVADLDGDGADDLIGFSAKGVETQLTKGTRDVFVFEDGFGDDVITDFDIGANGDQLDLSGLSAFGSLTEVKAAAAQDGDDTLITDGSNSIRLEDIQMTDLTDADFLFV
jgi:hypothetical protein